jgi:hypothetical protein
MGKIQQARHLLIYFWGQALADLFLNRPRTSATLTEPAQKIFPSAATMIRSLGLFTARTKTIPNPRSDPARNSTPARPTPPVR